MRRARLLSAATMIFLCMGLAPLAFSPSALGDEPGAGQPPVRINEVMASNTSGLTDPQGQQDDWIELHNAGDAPVDMAGLWLTDDPDEPTQWRFPATTAVVIPPKGYLIVWADGDIDDSGLHASFRLSASGEEVCLFAADGQTVIDSLSFGDQTANISYGRYPDANDTLRFFEVPTPGRTNNAGYVGEVAPLTFSHERGFYSTPFDLTITTDTPDAQILYTTDGRVPDDAAYRFIPGRTYTAPLRISKTTSVRAIAVKPGWKPTRLYTHTYAFDTRTTVTSLPMVSLVGDSAKTFYEPNGVMAIVGGTYNGEQWAPTTAGSYNNMLNRELERPVSAEWILPDNSEGFQMNCGLRVHGSGWTRPRYLRMNGYWSQYRGKIGLRLYFRGEYDKSRLDYPLFALSNAEDYATVILRAGHNDPYNPFVKDELLRRLHRDMGQVSCAGTFANLFINGEYKGYYNPTEQVTEESCQQWFGSDKPWDVMTMNGVRDGDRQSWDAMLAYARTHNLADPVFYAEMCKKLDVVCFIDYLIIRLWPNDWDWPQNNWSAACERSPAGQWKFFLWDAEGTFNDSPVQADRFGELNGQGSENSVLYRALKASPSFRMLFADRLYKHFYNEGALTVPNVQRRFYEMRDQLRGVIPSMYTDIATTWVPQRLSYFIANCTREGMYTFDGPTFTVNGAARHGGPLSATDLLGMQSSRQGPIYYTLDGSEPSQQATAPQSVSTTLVAADAFKRVLVPGRTVIGDWRGGGPYDDSAWTASSGAPGGIGYERSTGYGSYITTDVGAQMYTICSSCYIRVPFTFADDKSKLTVMTLRMRYDDGFVAYLNGVEIARRNFTGDPIWSSAATADHLDSDALNFESIDISQHIDELQPGANMLAIQGLNVSASSSDFLIAAELSVNKSLSVDPSPAPATYTSPIHLTRSTRVKARLRSGTTWSALADATFAVGPVAESLRISEIMYNPVDPNTEYIELTNIGSGTIDLSLVEFADGISFVFPAFELEPGGHCLVVQDVEAFEAKYGPGLPCVGQYQGSLDNAGEYIELRDAADKVIQAFSYGDDWYDITDGGGYSLTVKDPASVPADALDDVNAWRPSARVDGSPGVDDGAGAVESGGIVINELLANATGGSGDWVELHNVTDRAVDIGGWCLSDNTGNPIRYEIAAGTVLDPHGYLVLTEDSHFGNADDPGCHTPFGLSQNGETLCLYSASQGALTGYSERVEFGASESGVTLGRHPLSTGAYDFTALIEPTPGGPNAGPQVGPIVISEIMYQPDYLPSAEYIELFNAGDAEVTLYDDAAGSPWRLADDAEDPDIEVLLPGDPPITLAPGEYLLLVADRLMCQARFGFPTDFPALEWGSGRLDDVGDTISLSRPGQIDSEGVRHWIEVDCVTFSNGAHPERFSSGVDPWPVAAAGRGSSLTRMSSDGYGNDPNNWQPAFPSPGAAKRREGR